MANISLGVVESSGGVAGASVKGMLMLGTWLARLIAVILVLV